MSDSGVNRRKFLESARGTVTVGVAATLTGGLTGPAWAKSLKTVNPPTADILLRMCRVLYPHDDISDDYYAGCVTSLDEKAAADPALKEQINEGVSALNASVSGNFLGLDESAQVEALKAIEQTPFFQTVRGHMVTALYNDPTLWNQFGYEGPSFKYGGYLDRGFNDIDWLPSE